MVTRLLIFLCLALTASAQQAILPLLPRVSSGNTTGCCPAAATWIASEDWEGVGKPSGWSTNTISGDHGAVFFDYSVSPLWSSQSLQLTNGGFTYNENWHTAQTNVYYYFMWRPEVTTDGAVINYVTDNAANPLMYVYLVPSSRRVRVGLGAATTTNETATAITDGSTYHFWVHYQKGTGADAIYEVHWSTTPTKPADGSATHAKVTNGTATGNATGIWFYSEYAGTDWRIDKVRADDVLIGSDP